MKKFPSIDRIGKESTKGIFNGHVDVLEKVDGANFRFTHGKNVDGADDDSLVFGTKNVVYKNEKDIDKNFKHAIEHVRESCGPDHFKETVERDGDALTIFGEAMHAHTLPYGTKEHRDEGAPTWADVPNVLIFDVWSEQGGWLPWPSIKAVAQRLTLPLVETYHENHQFDDPDQMAIDWESHYRDGVAEGVVLRRCRGEQVQRAKYRTEKFLDLHGGGKQGDPEGVEDDSYILAQKLLSKEPWVEKWIHKYENRGREIEMSIMEDLWRDVFDDIIDEEYDEIFLGNWDIHTKRFRSYIADHTARELEAYLNRPDDSVLNQEATQ